MSDVNRKTAAPDGLNPFLVTELRAMESRASLAAGLAAVAAFEAGAALVVLLMLIFGR